MMKKYAGKTRKRRLRNQADTLCGKKARGIGYCEKCGSTEHLQWAHIITRGIGKLRYERKNWFCLCASCHRHFHNKPLEFAEFVKEKKGEDTYKWLIKESNNLEPLTGSWYQKQIDELKKSL